MSVVEKGMKHVIHLPINSSLVSADPSIIAASESQVYIQVNYRDDSTSVWTGHPLIPTSWKELFRWQKQERTMQLYKVTERGAMFLKSFGDSLSEKPLLGYNKIYTYSHRPANTHTNLWKILKNWSVKKHCSACMNQMVNSSIDMGGYKGWVVRKVSKDGDIFKLQEDLFCSSRPAYDFHGRLAFDSKNIYCVFRTDQDVYLSIQSYQPPSLQYLALLSIQKMFGVRSEVKSYVSGRHSSRWLIDPDSVCDVWERGITIDEFRERFGCKGKLF